MTLVETASSTALGGTTLTETVEQPTDQKFVLTLSCGERAGIVQAVTTFLFDRGFNIDEHQQFDDRVRDTLFLRTAFTGSPADTRATLEEEFRPIADRFGMKFRFADPTPQRVLVMVSKLGHCLNDLIFRWRAGTPGRRPGSGGVQPRRPTARWPRRPGCRSSTFPSPPTPSRTPRRACWTWWTEYDVDLVVLARYMQVLSDELCHAAGRPGDQHPPLVPARLQGRQALPPGLRARREDGRRHGPLRDRRPR